MDWWPGSLTAWLEAVAPLVAIGTFIFAIFQYGRTQQDRREDRRIEATKPFLEHQLRLYADATRCAALLAAQPDAKAAQKARSAFLQLYLGELALVEDRGVATAMIHFRHALEREAAAKELEVLSLRLAHACRKSLARSWNTSAWQSPRTE